MRIILRTIYAGPRGSYGPGSVVELERAEAIALIEGGFARPVDPPEVVPAPILETATEESETETAVFRAGRRRGR